MTILSNNKTTTISSKKQDKSTCERKCIVTGDTLEKNDMIRFVIDPAGNIIPDIDERIDGRGFWVTANKTAINTAVKKNIFAKTARKKISVSENLTSSIENLLKQKCLNLISFSKKASVLTSGFEKVKIALQKREVYLLIIASDGKENGIKKILPFTKNDLPVIKLFSSEELGHTIGKDNTVFIAVKKTKLTEKLFAECNRFCKFIENELASSNNNY